MRAQRAACATFALGLLSSACGGQRNSTAPSNAVAPADERPAEPTAGEPPGELTAADAAVAEDVAGLTEQALVAYDRGDFDEARAIAGRVLAVEPANVRMLRLAVSAACITGDAADAQKHFALLPAPDQEQIKRRCARYGVNLTVP